jgi:hypothetical protein
VAIVAEFGKSILVELRYDGGGVKKGEKKSVIRVAKHGEEEGEDSGGEE